MRSTDVLMSISLRRNILPGLTTLQMCPSFPIKDFSWRLVHVLRLYHFFRLAMASVNFASGTSMVMCNEFIIIPRYIRNVQGPSIFSKAKGIPRSLKAFIMVLSWALARPISFANTAKKSSE